MNIQIKNDNLYIQFSTFETVLSFRRKFEIPLKDIETVSTDKPECKWYDLKVPGTAFPGLIKAGTYYTKRGKEFWYITKQTRNTPLNIVLKNNSYKKIVLGIRNNTELASEILNTLSLS